MPIPTDTFWNIRRLNRIFAITAVLLVAVTGFAIFQDYDKRWREPQRTGRVWEAALVEEKIERTRTEDFEKQIAELTSQIESRRQQIETQNQSYKDLAARKQQLESDRANLEFRHNNLKATVQVDETGLQDAITAGDTAQQQALLAKLEAPRRQVAEQAEKLFAMSQQIAETNAAMDAITVEVDQLAKQRTQLTGDLDLMQKKRDALQPKTLRARGSELLRQTPLLQFINPAERVQQVVLPDVQTDMAYMKVPTVDRCMTCHVNVSKKDFTEERILAYLEEQVATTRHFMLPAEASGKPADPAATVAAPGAVAMPDFWHGWASALLPAAVEKSKARVTIVAKAVGKDQPVSVTYDGQPVEAFTYDFAARDAAAVGKQNDILVAALEALYLNRKAEPLTSGKAVATIPDNADEKKLATARTSAMKYAEELQASLENQLEPNMYALLRDRYRYAMVEIVNPARRSAGLAALDASPVMLAHPQLDLYVDIDSPHSFEAVGCTSCHDGSGQETDFVLAAHTARPIWVDSTTGEPVLPAMLTEHPAAGDGHHAQQDLSDMRAAMFPHEESAAPASSAKPHLTEAPANASPTKYVDPITGKSGRAIPQAVHWQEKYEGQSGTSFKDVYHYWDWPMRSPKYLQANCTRCHTDVYDIKEHAPVAYEGRTLFTTMGCVNCHQMDSIPPEQNKKVGTDLRHVNDKLSPAFVNTWIWAPKAFRPSTKMPHFFMLENNSSEEELRRTRQEARAMTEYLVRTATPMPNVLPVPTDLAGSAENGAKVFTSVGCLGCHSNLNETGEKWITTDLVKRAGLKADQAKESYAAMSYNQRQLYAFEHLAEPVGTDEIPRYDDGTGGKPGTPKPVFQTHGPELSGIGTKLTADRTEEQARAWLFNWLKNPTHYSEYTSMPSLRLSDQEALDLAAYLLAQKRTVLDPKDSWSAGLTPVDPEKLREMTSLFLRSRFSAQTAYEKAVDEAELTRLAADALTTAAVDSQTALEHAKQLTLEERQLLFLGKRLVAHYGCMSCHAINGAETIVSPCTELSDWGQKSIDKLDFGFLDHHKLQGLPPTSTIEVVNGLSAASANLVHTLPNGTWSDEIAKPVEAAWPHVEHTRNDWLTHKLKNTRVYDRGKVSLEPRPDEKDPGKPYDKLKMPTFYLTDDEVDALVTFVVSNRDRLISEKLTSRTTDEQARRIAFGRYLTTKYNCVGCHQTEANTPPVQQYFKSDVIGTHAPPSLRGEGNKIQHDWLFNFLKNVEPIRPLPVIRMPSFPVTDPEATAIAAYFAAVSNEEAGALRRTLGPVVKYIEQQKKAAKTVPDDPKAAWPGDDWYTLPAFSPARERLIEWGLANRQLNETQLNPALNKPDELGRNYRTLLFKVLFTEELYTAPYPFVDSPRPSISDERFKLGEQFFYEMQCLKCHVLGDPSIAGANKTPTAPNLSLTARRLQRRWVRHWVQEPAIIQAGTAMPPFFTGLPVFQLHGQPWPKSQGAAPDEVQRVESIYGDTVEEQTDLVLDFLYAAGVRGHTGVQPASVGAPPVTQAPQPPAPPPAPEKPAAPVEPKPAPKVEAKPTPAPAKPQAATPTPPPAAETAAPEKPAAPAPAPAASGKPSVIGKVTYKGTPPDPQVIDMSGVAQCAAHHADPVLDPTLTVNENGTLMNVIVYVSANVPDGPHAAPTTPAVLDQKGCMYEPHVLPMMIGQQLVIKNDDPFLHNVHSLSSANPQFNFAQPNKDPGKPAPEQPKVPETFRVKCDVHPWMAAYIGAFDHPFFSATKDDGTFAIPALPPGTYTLTAWHEQLGTQEKEVTVEAGKPATVEFTFGEGAQADPPKPVREVKLSAVGH